MQCEKEDTSSIEDKYNIGLVCLREAVNPGRTMAYIALNQVLCNLGYSVKTIDGQNLNSNDVESLNSDCDMFMVAGESVWSYEYYKVLGKTFFLDFVPDDKKKIAYAVSLGKNQNAIPTLALSQLTNLIQRFDSVSVCQEQDVNLLKDNFGAEGLQVLEPAFLLPQEDYEPFVQKGSVEAAGQYILSFLEDWTDENREVLQQIAEERKLRLLQVSRQKTEVEDWIKYIANAECVVSEDYYDIVFSMIFSHPVIGAKKQTIVNQTDIERMNAVIAMERQRSIEWLKEELQKPKAIYKNIRCVTKKECCGCGACYNICPVDAITMEYDEDGFLYPVVNEEKCIHCQKCIKACPSLNPRRDNKKEPECYAAYTNDEVREVSSSGGIFSLVADYVLDNGGAVCGAAFDDDQKLRQIVIYDRKDMPKLRGSKYLQSNTKQTYKEIKHVLDAGRMALYVGCPCQVAGLRTFLGKDYGNLYTLDLLCHGGPSPVIFQKYLDEVHHGKEIAYIGFRDKDYYGWSTEMTVKYTDGKVYRKLRSEDLHYRSFLPCLSVRPHCQVCKYSVLPRQGDFTLGDFWGVEKYNPDFTDGKGTSIVSVNSSKGEQLLDIIRERLGLLEPIDRQYVLSHGQPFGRPFKNNPMRYRFVRMIKDCSYQKTIDCCADNVFEYALYGLNGDSYSDILGYYALYKTMSGFNYTVLPVWRRREQKSVITPLKYRFHIFANRYYPAVYSLDAEQRDETIRCRHLLAGPQQVWKEADTPLLFMDSSRQKRLYYHQILKEEFSLMLLQDIELYDALVSNSEIQLPRNYIAVYLRQDIEGKNTRNITEALQQQGKTVVELDDNMMVEDWIAGVKHCELLITDCVDGINMAILYQTAMLIWKPSGKTDCYAKQMGLEVLTAESADKLLADMQRAMQFSFEKVHKKIETARRKAKGKLHRKMRYQNPAVVQIKRACRFIIRCIKRVVPGWLKRLIKKILGR